jgi:hypothetical protein
VLTASPSSGTLPIFAGFTDSAVAIPQQQRYLWGRIHERLDRLGNQLSPADRRHIEALLIKKIGKPPTKAQRAKLDRQRERTLRNLSDHFRQG